MGKAEYHNDGDAHRATATTAGKGGDILPLPDGRASFVEGLAPYAVGDALSLRKEGIARVVSASGTTFAAGEEVYYDVSAGLAIRYDSANLNSAEDYYLGTAHKAKTAGTTSVEVEFNAHCFRPAIPVPYPQELPCADTLDETAGVKNVHTLIPANHNKRGFLVLGIYGVVTEVFAGATQAVGIVTAKDGDGNVLSTLTVSGGGADALNDIVVGTNKVWGAATGDAIKVVPAGKSITAQVTQETSGSGAAGKLRVYALVMPLV